MTNPAWMRGMAPMETLPAPPATHPSRRPRLLGAGFFLLMALSPSVALLHRAQAQTGSPTSEEITVEGEGEVQRIAVPYHRTDLATSPGARSLVARIDRATLTVCGDSTAIGAEIRRAIERSDCRHDAVMRAVRDVHDVNLDQAAAQYGLPQ